MNNQQQHPHQQQYVPMMHTHQQQQSPRQQMTYQQQQQQQQQQLSNNNNKMKIVAGYSIQQKLGSGSFAIVYKGVRIQPTGNVLYDTAAIKAIARNSDKLTKKVLQNLEMEISILRTYRHRNIVCMHDVQKTANHFYLVLEYCSGGDVQGLIRSRKARRLSEGLTRRLMRDLEHGLAFLWKQQLIHRDIKPQNLLLTGPLPLDEMDDPENTDEAEERRRIMNFPSTDFCLKIADFGFARHLQSTSLAETLCGSPLYMAPEILQHHRYDAKADLWSVGTVLFEMISGEPPFHGENHIDLLRNIQRMAVRLPKDVRVSKECVKLLRLLLSRNPLTRAGFKEFFEACDAFVALGCQGISTLDEGTCKRPSVDLGTIPEYQEDTATTNATQLVDVRTPTPTGPPLPLSESVVTSNSSTPQTQQSQQPSVPFQPNETPTSTSPVNSNPNTISSTTSMTAVVPKSPRTTSIFNPLGMYSSPKSTSTSPLIAMTELPTIHSSATGNKPGTGMPQPIEMPTRQKDVISSVSSPTADENSFVMVEHGTSSLHKSSTTPTTAQSGSVAPASSDCKVTNTAMVSYYNESNRQQPQQSQQQHQQQFTEDPSQHNYNLEPSPPTSTGYFMSRIPSLPTNRDFTILPKGGMKGMLSTSPGTGGALMNMLTGGRPNLLTRVGSANSNPQQTTGGSMNIIELEKQLEQQFKEAAKMLATAEDIGRRAICVAHLGDKRAYYSMRLLMMSESHSSSILSITPMEGIEEESSGDHDDSGGTVTDDDDSSSTEVMASTTIRQQRRKSSMSNADKSMPDVKSSNDGNNDDDEEEEMPFAVPSESVVSPLLSARMPSRSGSTMNTDKDSGSISSRRTQSKPSPAVIRSYFNEALTCYLKALKMIKGAITISEGVSKEIVALEEKRLSSERQNYVAQLKKQCDVTSKWLSNQFQGVLERGNATNMEIRKLPELSSSSAVSPTAATGTGGDVNELVVPSSSSSRQENVVATSIEELLYTHSLGYGREGAVKQLLGHYEAARACYRSAGLLAETLLMEPNLESEDRITLESYVDGFAAQITELDEALLLSSSSISSQHQQQGMSRLTVSGSVTAETGNSSSHHHVGSMVNSSTPQQPSQQQQRRVSQSSNNGAGTSTTTAMNLIGNSSMYYGK